LNSPLFTKVLYHLKTQADLIVIDSAPVLLAIETKAIANVVDGALLVVSDGQTRGKEMKKAVDYFQGRHTNNLLGLVFNRVKLPRSYDYYSSYTYGVKPLLDEKPKRQAFGLANIWPFSRPQQQQTTTLNLDEVADYLGVGEDTARRWCEQGRIPATKTGRRWSVRLADLNEFVAIYQRGDTATEAGVELVSAMEEKLGAEE
jgi:excisionase family DNA binding protein